MNPETYLVFALGPVQGFIAQSRRTADGWMGSYLLSYLAGRAIAAVESNPDLKLVIPDSDARMLHAIRQEKFSATDEQSVAALPNTVVFRVPSTLVPLDVGQDCEHAVRLHWKEIVDAIWAARVDAGGTTLGELLAPAKDTWTAQTGRHWEAYWAWGANTPEAFQNLAARKALRDFPSWEELGDRCTVCSQRMPLLDPAHGSANGTMRDAAKKTWELWEQRLNALPRDAPRTLVAPDGKERLCAICLIKRLVPWTFNPVSELWVGRLGGFPSTSTMCTVKFRADVLEAAVTTPALMAALRDYEKSIRDGDSELAKGTLPSGIFEALDDLAKNTALRTAFKGDLDSLLRRDGDFYLYGESVANERGFAAKHQQINAVYHRFLEAADTAGIERPPIYYALLAMDGDNMGAFMENIDNSGGSTTGVSAVLNAFAHGVPGTVKDCGGQTIFAGGDDVLALLPFDDAVPAAIKLRNAFRSTFSAYEDAPTISAGLVFAHHQAPLGRVIQAAQAVLKSGAKAAPDKNAIAIQRFMRGGPGDTFVASWSDLGRFETLIDTMARRDQSGRRRSSELAGRTVYGLRRFADVLSAAGFSWQEGHRQAFLAALLKKSRLTVYGAQAPGTQNDKERPQLARANDLLALCDAAAVAGRRSRERLAIEPLIVARFLARGGRES